MKYLILRTEEDQEVPIIFAPQLIHSNVALALSRSLHKDHGVRSLVVAAGFITPSTLHCFGDSLSLRVSSRGAQDQDLIKCYPFYPQLKELK